MSDTRPANLTVQRVEQCPAVRSSSHDAITLPAAPDFCDLGQVKVISIVLGSRSGGVFRIDHAMLLRCWPPENREPLGIGGHQAVLDPVMNHLDENAGAVWPAMQMPCSEVRLALLRPGVRTMSPRPGARVAKIGSRRLTTSLSPPIIMQ